MRSTSTSIDGVLLVEFNSSRDERGSFARLSCVDELARIGVNFTPLQTSLSRNLAAMTLRGMHYCLQPEAKIIHCIRGRIYDVVLDLRTGSKSFGRWFASELSENDPTGFYVPPGIAHGFLTLESNSDVLYQIDRLYDPSLAVGVRWNDPAFNISWPGSPLVMHGRDASYPDFRR